MTLCHAAQRYIAKQGTYRPLSLLLWCYLIAEQNALWSLA